VGFKTTRLAIHGTPSQPMVFAVWRCAGGCEAFVSSPHAYCLACAAREESAKD
jgi:hypothetical protein